jgi:hypothetical protein
MALPVEKYSGYYEVVQGTHRVVAYDSRYFRSIREVVADLTGLIEGDLGRPAAGDDYVVWWAGRVLAVYHLHMDDEGKRLVFFDDPRNDPRSDGPTPTWPGWPTYEQWVAGGKGPLTYDPEAARNYPEG